MEIYITRKQLEEVIKFVDHLENQIVTKFEPTYAISVESFETAKEKLRGLEEWELMDRRNVGDIVSDIHNCFDEVNIYIQERLRRFILRKCLCRTEDVVKWCTPATVRHFQKDFRRGRLNGATLLRGMY